MYQVTHSTSPKKESTIQDLQVRIQRAKNFIHNNLESSIDIKSVASLACLSEFHFIRIFNKFVGVTPYQYILQNRIIKAKELLATTSLPIKKIADLCGFETVQTFRKCFKRIVNQSPSEFLKMEAA